MAKIISPILSAAAGTVGGAVYQRSNGVQRIQARTHTRQPRSAAQVNTRQGMAQMGQFWASGSDADRQLWEDLAPRYPTTDSLGNTIQRTGWSLYVAANLPLFALFGTPPANPPDPIPDNPIPVLTAVSIVLSVDGLNTYGLLTGASFIPSQGYAVSVTSPVSPGRLSLRSATYSGLQVSSSGDGQYLFFSLDTTTPGLMAVPGMRTGVRVALLNNNWLTSEPAYISSIAILGT